MCTASPTSSRPQRLIRCPRSSPRSSSITMYGKPVVVSPGVEDLDDVRALDDARRLGFATETRGRVPRSAAELGVDELDGDALADGRVRAS